MTNRKFIRPMIAGLSMALISGTALAYGSGISGPSDRAAKSGCNKMSSAMAHGERQRGAMIQLPSAVIDQLNLTQAQKVALFDAQTATKAMRDGMRESMRKARQQRNDADESAQFNPREMFRQQDERIASMQQARQNIQQQWLGFWDTLSDDQKSVVRDYMQSKAKNKGSKRS